MDSYFANERPEMQAFLPAGSLGRTLEIGCAGGNFSAALNATERWGVEPFPDAAAAARAKGINALTGIYSDVEAQLPAGHFDLIVANDVIEHMPDHEAFLRAVKAKLAPGGRILISVPNIRHLPTLFDLVVRRDWRYAPDGVLDHTHLRFFTRKSLTRCMDECGYEIEAFAGLCSLFRAGASRKKALACAALIGATLGHAWDTQYLQFGLLVRPRQRSEAL